MSKPLPSALALDDFERQYVTPPTAASAQISHRKATASAIRHLSAAIGRTATVADLTDCNMKVIESVLRAAGRAYNTIARVSGSLAMLSRVAVRNRLLTRAMAPISPKIDKSKVSLTREEVERILIRCLNVEESIAGFAGGDWWLTLCLLMINTGRSAEQMLLLPFAAWNSADATLHCNEQDLQLHLTTQRALDRLFRAPPQTFSSRLLPWTLDGGQPPYHGLYPRFKNIVQGAGIDRKHVSPKLLTQAANHCGPRTMLEGLDIERLTEAAERQRDAGESPERILTPRVKTPQRRRRRGADFVSEDSQLRTFVDEKYVPARLPQADEKGTYWHRHAVKLLGKLLGREPLIKDLTAANIEDTMAYFIGCGSSQGSANHARACLVAQWNFAHQRGILATGPQFVPKHRVKKRVPSAWTLEEVERILASTQSLEHLIYGVPAATYWPALILLIYETGLRIGAVMNLRLHDLDEATGWVTVPAEIQKQEADQVFQLSPLCRRLVAATQPERREYLFRKNKPKEWYKQLQPAYRQLLQRANLPHSDRDKFHKLRRTSASYWASKLGVQAASLHLGHSSLAVTNRYLDPKIVGAPQPIEVLPQPQWQPRAE